MLQTAITHQENYSNNATNRLHSTEYNSRRSRHGDSPHPAGSSTARRRREQELQTNQPQPRPTASRAQLIVDEVRARRQERGGNEVPEHNQPRAGNVSNPPATNNPASSPAPMTELSAKLKGTQCLGPALKAERLPLDFKGPRKVPNYTADMDLVAWLENYELGMDILEATEAICARYLTMMLEGPARSWLQNLPPNSINSWDELKELFIKKFQGTCKRPSTIADLERCVQKEGDSFHHWARRVSEIINSSDTIIVDSAALVLERNCKFDILVHKIGRCKRSLKSLIELIDIVTRYADSDKTKDTSDDEDDKGGKGKKNGDKGN